MKTYIDQRYAAHWLKKIRRIFGFSQKDLARELMVSPATIAHWELENNPVPGPVLKLLRFYAEAALFEEELQKQGEVHGPLPNFFENRRRSNKPRRAGPKT